MSMQLFRALNCTSGSSYDTDAQAFFTALEGDASPVTLNSTQKGAVNQLVLDMKAASVWTKCKAIYPFIGGVASSHKYNLKDPRDLDAAYRLTFTNSPTHSSSGVDWNGSTQYADTHMVASTLTASSTHASYYSEENTSGSCGDIGTPNDGGGSHRFLLTIDYSGAGAVLDIYEGSTDRILPGTFPSFAGFFVGTRTSTTRADLYRNGTSAGNITSTLASTIPTTNFEIGRAGALYTNRKCAFASIGDGLNSTENAAFYTAVQAYQTTLGRQI